MGVERQGRALIQIKLLPGFASHTELFAAPQYAENGCHGDDFPQSMTRFTGAVPVF
jgi:hypothetical protein